MQQPNNNPADFKFQNVTRQELKKIEKSMKKPEFMGLLNEYMIQISDPKNREEYDQYLKQMQQQGQLPKHMKLIQLSPEFCIRTQIVSQKNKKHEMKFFINFCSTDALQQPMCQPTQNNGKLSFGWKVPNSMGKIRYDQDKNGNPCQVADAAFHTQCFKIIDGQSKMPVNKHQFKSMIIAIGLQSAQKQLGQRKQTLSKDYDILKNIKCKGGKPALLPMRFIKGKAHNKGEGAQQEIERDNQGKQTKLQKQLNSKKQEYLQQKKKEKPKEQDQQMQEELQESKKLVQDLQEGIQQPKYSSIFTYPVDYSEYMQDPSYMKASKTPSHFTVQFKLPRVQTLQEISGDSLNVNQNRVILKIGQKYFIDLSFDTFKMKYKLLTQKIKAKFDKKKKTLKVTIAIDQSIKYIQPELEQPDLISPIQNDKLDNLNQNYQGQVLQNQTWKNKVLEFADPEVNLKVLDNNKNQEIIQEKQQQKKLIQQIDEDDVQDQQEMTQENHHNNKSKASKDQNSTNQQIVHSRGQVFSLNKYRQKLQKSKQNKVEQSSLTQSQQQLKIKQAVKLNFLFQQTNDKVVLVIKMQNYKKQDVLVVYDQQSKIDYFIKWNKNIDKTSQANLQDLTKIQILHLRIKEDFLPQIKKSEVVLRVGFVAIFLHKQNKNKFWENSSVESLTHNEGQNYEKFKDQILKIQQKNLAYHQRLAQQIKAKQVQNNQLKPVQNSQPQEKQKQQQIKSKQTDKNQKESKLQEIQEEQQSKKNRSQVQNSKNRQNQGLYSNFIINGPQFILFQTNFIQVLD